jgi:hypothetical protein
MRVFGMTLAAAIAIVAAAVVWWSIENPTYGDDVHFRRAFVEMVPAGSWPFNAIGWPASLAGEPVTRGLETKMPWLPHPQYLSGRFDCDMYKDSHCLHGGHLARN